ncbi:hypothetical protein DPMN_041316 [Dreissena polymorpha]|uniref:TGF-beta family profile domain-containing protein n=2 Tax=Dreissena polymorpha TaxID=45954 RepID=A0A9D4CWL6_DREPO|nr:hypothetical protein DPMN_041316 [Dreissena polymorpha]
MVACVRTSDESSDLTVDNGRMHEAVRSLLGFKGNPRAVHPARLQRDAPQFMMDLYNRISEGGMPASKLKGNTVRSLRSKIESLNGNQMFVFNLTSLVSTFEDTVSAEIHLFKRKKDKFNKNAEMTILLHKISSGNVEQIAELPVSFESYGWQSFDVFDALKLCSSSSSSYQYYLGLNFKISNPHGNIRMLDLKKLMHKHSVPYLIVYSNDTKNVDIDELEQLSLKQKNTDTLPAELSSVDSVLPDIKQRNKRSVLDNNADYPPIINSRARSMSILTNEIPEDPEDYNRPYTISIKKHKTHPGMLQTRKESRHKLTDKTLIPYPGEYVRNRKRDKKRNRKKGKKNNQLELPKEWEDLRARAEEEVAAGACSKKKLVVNFNDIGWGEWIISPKSFKAHYCSGTCSFPLTKKMRPSNHATIQSLVNAVGINPEVPAPCCVPDKLSSITLLYFDENGNVVLKNYPNMTVQKCACR